MRYRANLLSTAAFCGLSALAVAWGWADAGGLRADLPGHATAVIGGAIGLLLGLPVLASAFAVNRRVRATRAAPEARWHVTPALIVALRDWQGRTGAESEWRPTRGERARGIEVCWAGEHLVAGGHYWRIAPGQYPAFVSVRAQLAWPVHVALHTRQLWSPPLTSLPRLVVSDRVYRIPVPDEDRARQFARHFNGILDADYPWVRARRLRRLSRWAFGAGAVFLVLLLVGLGFAWHDNMHGIHRGTPERAALIFGMVLGVMGTPMMLLAGLALRMKTRE